MFQKQYILSKPSINPFFFILSYVSILSINTTMAIHFLLLVHSIILSEPEMTSETQRSLTFSSTCLIFISRLRVQSKGHSQKPQAVIGLQTFTIQYFPRLFRALNNRGDRAVLASFRSDSGLGRLMIQSHFSSKLVTDGEGKSKEQRLRLGSHFYIHEHKLLLPSHLMRNEILIKNMISLLLCGEYGGCNKHEEKPIKGGGGHWSVLKEHWLTGITGNSMRTKYILSNTE